MSEPDRIDQLASAYLDGVLGEAEHDELDRLLRADPAAARRFARLMRSSVALDLHARDEAAVGAAELEAPSRKISVRRPRLRRRVPSGSWLSPTLAAAATLAVAIGGAAWWHGARPASLGHAVATAGGLTIDGRAMDAADLDDGSLVATAAGFPATIELADGSALGIEGGSAVRIGREHDVWRIHLRNGTADCRVAHQGPGHGFTIATGEAEVRVVGTRFRVAVRPDGTGVTVDEGVVEVEAVDAPGRTERLRAGDAVTVLDGRMAVSRPVDAAASPAALWSADGEAARADGPLEGRWLTTGEAPPGNRSRGCYEGASVTEQGGPATVRSVRFGSPGGLFTVHGDPTIRFRYWISSSASWIGVQLRMRSDAGVRLLHLELQGAVFDAWTEVAVPCSRLQLSGAGGALRDGETVQDLVVQGGDVAGSRLLVDDLRIDP